MYKKSQERLPEILRLYRENKSLTEIGEAVGTHRDVIKRLIVVSGIDYDKEQEVLKEQRLEQVIELYNQGKSQSYIEQTLNFTRKTIRELLKSKDLHYKSKSEQWRIRYGNTLNEDVFDTITPESAYWLGMLYTDGHIGSGKRGYNIEFGLHEQDKEHLQKFLNFLGSNNPIQDDSRGGYCRVRIGSEKVYNRLRELGFTNKKSWDAVPHELLKNNRNFWRGCIDGDGGIYIRKDKCFQVFFCGTLDSVCEFIFFCESNAQLYNKKYPTRVKGVCHYEISYYGQEALRIADYLYKDSTTYLDRKYQKYLEIINSNNLSPDNL